MRFVTLSNSFYQQYANCPEILSKPSRPYACLAIQVEGVTFAIPLRHHISHKHSYITQGNQGLDYTKAVVISDPSQIGSVGVQIESKDYQALKGKEHIIAAGMKRYVLLYKKAKRYKSSKHYSNVLTFSSLKYFDHLF